MLFLRHARAVVSVLVRVRWPRVVVLALRCADEWYAMHMSWQRAFAVLSVLGDLASFPSFVVA